MNPLVLDGATTVGTRESWATLSPCGLYRYALGRAWDPEPEDQWDPLRPVFSIIMLNPSTADEHARDRDRREGAVRLAVGLRAACAQIFGLAALTSALAETRAECAGLRRAVANYRALAERAAAERDRIERAALTAHLALARRQTMPRATPSDAAERAYQLEIAERELAEVFAGGRHANPA